MMNWNDLRVEQEIAQERYQRLIRAREIERLIGSGGRERSPLWRLALKLGQRLESWGQSLRLRAGLKTNDPICCT